MNKLLLIISFFTIFFSCSGQNEEQVSSKSKVETLSPGEFKSLLYSKSVQLVDVRTSQELERGKIEGTINIDYLGTDFKEQVLEQLDKDQPVAVYCAVGGRSARAAKLLAEMGFKKIYDLKGGYKAWARE